MNPVFARGHAVVERSGSVQGLAESTNATAARRAESRETLEKEGVYRSKKVTIRGPVALPGKLVLDKVKVGGRILSLLTRT